MLVAVFGAGWVVNGWRKDAQLAELTAARAQADLGSANLALQDLREAGALIHQKAGEFAGIQSILGAKLDAIRKDFKNASPLPAGCRPDDFRVRKLAEAVAATQQAAAAR
ncbi:hypothetical protein AB4Z48_17620 [Cupriavidus sp. 2TAF22]|uniref:hypothetical protein n=1 Tax=unclassified Cupriavidus TaxID=2640874 RepID=UPI003F91DD50